MTSRKFSFEKILNFPIEKGVADEITHRDVEEHAYFLWLESGQPEGRDQEFWLQAEKAMKSVQHPHHPQAIPPRSDARKVPVPQRPIVREFKTNQQSASPENFRPVPSLPSNGSSEDKFMDQLFGSVFEEIDFDGLFNTCVNSP